MAAGIVVTGVGGGVGQSVLKCLQGSEYRVVGMDADPLAAGLHAVPVGRRGELATSPGFVDHLLEVCDGEGCTLVFPGLEPELLPLAMAAERMRAAGVIPVVSSPQVISVCDDKAATASFLTSHGFAAPITQLYTDDVDASWFPLVLKPQHGGARSQHTYVVRDMEQFRRVSEEVDPANCVIQEYIEGDEFTAGSVTLGGRCRGSIVMRRTLRAGDTYRAFVVRDRALEEHVRAVVETLGPFGACNVQFRLRAGRPVIFEINARCSGTTHARALAGFNEPRLVADYLVHGLDPVFDVREITVLRYWNELVVDEGRLSSLVEGRRSDSPGAGL
jgi:carbamoyl-phosphate synthase large subunit